MKRAAPLLLALASLSTHISADEGMWTFDKLPHQKLAEKYDIKLSPSQVERLQKAALRVSTGGSASFVSPSGLVLTNHHVAYSAIDNLSTTEMNYIKEGFYAEELGDEIPCHNVHLDQLISIRDITSQLNGQIDKSLPLAKQEHLRREALNRIKEEAEKESGLHVQVVELFKGGKHHLYFYKRYTDVRLVMAPDITLASFGGDEMNFEFPRMNFDFAFLRAYENGKPVETNHYFQWNSEGPIEGEPLFVVGNPGSTNRIFTADRMEVLKRENIPSALAFIDDRLKRFNAYSKQSNEHALHADNAIKTLMNSRKVYKGRLKALHELPIIANKRESEATLLAQLPESQREPWSDISICLKENKESYEEALLLEFRAFIFSKTYGKARHLVRLSQELQKPSEARLREYVDSELPTVKRAILSNEPVYPEFEVCAIQAGLDNVRGQLTNLHPLVAALEGSPSATEIMAKTQITSLDYCSKLLENPKLITESDDPLIQLVQVIDPYARHARQLLDDDYKSVMTDAYSKISQTLYQKEGDSLYPDATFSLRLTYGDLKGYHEESQFIQPISNLGGLFEIHEAKQGKGEYELHPNWISRGREFDLSIPVNFVSTHDIIGGNSGSPVVNEKGELVGLIFDGNKDSFIWDEAYDDTQGRAISVHAGGIFYCIDQMYRAQRLREELSHQEEEPEPETQVQ